MSKPVVPAPCIEGAAIVEAIKRAGVEFVVSVPDRVTSETGMIRSTAGRVGGSPAGRRTTSSRSNPARRGFRRPG